MNAYGYRRGSIFWALTLIGVGGLFLYQNFNPEVHPWHIIAKFWPVLIIFWGLSKLIDYIHAQARPETAPPALFSASEVVLLILILLFGSLVSKIILRPWQPGAWGINVDDDEFANLFLNSYTYTQTANQAVSGQPHLVLVDRRGDLLLNSSDQPSFDAVVKVTVHAPNEDAARKINDQLKFAFVQQGGNYLFQSNLDSLPERGRNVRLDITLRVPKATSTELTAERGDITVDGLQADQSLTERRGDVLASNITGIVRIQQSHGSTQTRSINGNVEIDGRGNDVEAADVKGSVTVNGDFSGDVQFRNIAQNLRFTSSRTNLIAQKLTGRLDMAMGSLEANGIDGPFEISTREKDISLEGFKHEVKIENTNGHIELRTAARPTHPIDVTSEKGGIELVLPSGSNFQIDAVARHGEVDCGFSGKSLKVTNEGDAPSITGSYGQGGPLIRLNTTYGSIRIAAEGTGNVSPRPAPSTSPGEKTRLQIPRRRSSKHFRAVAVRIDSLDSPLQVWDSQ